MRTAVQLKALIRNMAKQLSISPQALLTHYMMERLLERISLSRYRNNFVLKGGMLIASFVGLETRSTADIDATLRRYPLIQQAIEDALAEIIATQMDDGVVFEIGRVDEIREGATYTGFRASLDAVFDGTQTKLKVDITAGDPVTPGAVSYRYPLMFEERQIEILSYNIESVLAEKLETVVVRGIANTRMRDFYDIFVLYTLRGSRISPQTLAEAVTATVTQRGSANVCMSAEQTFAQLRNSVETEAHWLLYQKRYAYAREISFGDVMGAVESLWALVLLHAQIA